MEGNSILGAGGAAFVKLTLMEAGGSLQSTGSLKTGAGTLAQRLHAKFRGEASPSMKALLDSPAGRLSKAPLIKRKLGLRFKSAVAGTFTVQGKVGLTVVAGEDDDKPATLIVAATFTRTDAVNLAVLDAHMGNDGTLFLTPIRAEDGKEELPFGEGQPVLPVTIHGPGLAPVVTTADEMDEEAERVEWDVSQRKDGKAPAAEAVPVEEAEKFPVDDAEDPPPPPPAPQVATTVGKRSRHKRATE